MHDGDAIEVIDSAAQHFHASIQIEGPKVSATLMTMLQRPKHNAPRVTIAQGVPKGQKMDFIVEKLTELGVADIIPLQSERTIVTDVSANKLERWRRLAKTAAQQCGRSEIPSIEEPIAFDRLLTQFKDYDRVLLPWELVEYVPLRVRLPDLMRSVAHTLVVIGPEGGFSHAEAQAAQNAGAQLISLGPRILRTETAGLLVLAVLGYICE